MPRPLCVIHCASASDHNSLLVVIINYNSPVSHTGPTSGCHTGQYLKLTQKSAHHIIICLMEITNPYQALYRGKIPKPTPQFTLKQAQQMATQMSLMYNAFGGALKDVVGLLSILYSSQKQSPELPQIASNPPLGEAVQTSKAPAHHVAKIEVQEKGADLNEQAVNYPDFAKYMIKIEEKPSIKVQLSQKLGGRQKKENKNEESRPKPVERIQVVRGMREREVLNGYSCEVCANFYRALGEDYADSRGQNKLCNDCSRHRSNLPPTNFYTDFSQQFGFDD